MKKLIITQKLVKLKIKLLLIILNTLLLNKNFVLRLGQANLTSKTNIPDLVKKTDFDKKTHKLLIKELLPKHELKKLK